MKEADNKLFLPNVPALKERSFGAILYMDDRFFMMRAIRLARKGIGRVSPNPRVGAVVVRDGRVLSEGFHAHFGGPHAEIAALSNLGRGKAEGAALFVNLEPCCHMGKTAPCTDAIIQAGLRRVVIGTPDPNPLVSGKGIKRLQESGIRVDVGVAEAECVRLNQGFFKYITGKGPFVTLKIAQTLDGKIATRSRQSRWITCEDSRRRVHALRRESDAVLVGIGTVLADDPELSVRLVKGLRPKRIVLDSRLRIPLNAQLVNGEEPAKTIVATAAGVSAKRMQALRKLGVTVWVLKKNSDGQVDLKTVMKQAAQEGITSILVEGGKQVFTSFIKANLADRIVLFIAPKVFGQGIDVFGDLGVDRPDGAVALQPVRWFRSGCDMVFEGEF